MGGKTTTFAEKIDRSGGPTACWPWKSCVDGGGYGTVTIKNRQLGAHRVAWEEARGEIPPGLCVLHTCDNPPCCNPAHMFLGTHLDNANDREAKGRGKPCRGEASPSAIVTTNDVIAIRAARQNGVTLATLAAKYGLTKQAVSLIGLRRNWKHVA